MEIRNLDTLDTNLTNHINVGMKNDVNYISNNSLVIEEVSRNHKLLRRHKLSQRQIHIGRDYHNDIILADPHICPSHLSIEQVNGQWLIEDNQTVNGSFIEGTKKKNRLTSHHLLNDGDIITLGKSQLRILFTHHPVEPTLALSSFESLIDLMRHPAVLLLSVIVFTLISGGTFFLNTPTEINFSQLLVPTIGMTLGFALWPAGIALVSHLNKHETRIMAQLGISFAFFNIMLFSDFLETLTFFNSAENSLISMFFVMTFIVLVFTLFWLNIYIGFQMPVKRRVIIATSMTLLLFGGSYLVQYSNKPNFNPRPQYDATVMMPSFLLVPSTNVDKFIEKSDKLFDKVQEEAFKK